MAHASASAIRLEGLSKRYGDIAALRNVSIEVFPGEIFGFLGLNGAGKTTTIRILLDLVRPTEGRAFIFGEDCRLNGLAVRRQLGYLPSELGFYADMRGDATLDLLGRLAPRGVDPQLRRSLLERFELAAADLRRPIREYSTGMKRKLGLVQAFQSDAPLLILDEPTDGLDPLMQTAVYELLADTRRRERTVFMSSHVLSEVERVCDRIALLRAGELVLVSAVDAVRRMAARTVTVRFGADVAAPADGWPEGVEPLDIAARVWRLRVAGAMGPLLGALGSRPVADLDVQEMHLEDVLRRYYREGRIE
jgi:ABC-type multidrug transport system ATPase subunit